MAGEEFVAQGEAEGRGRLDSFTSRSEHLCRYLNLLTPTNPSVLRLITLFYS